MRAPEQALVVERILRHVDAGTTDLAERSQRYATTTYQDPDLLRREITEVLRRRPTIVAQVAQLPNTGDFVTANVAGLPILVVRQDTGSIGAFVNICRHRGTQVVTQECGAARANGFTCPWHGWRYDLNGCLTAVPDHQRGFPDVDLSTTGLTPLPTEVRYGFVWVTADRSASTDVRQLIGSLDDELDAYRLDEYDLHSAETRVADFNWKRGVEAFLETYHFRWIHPAMKKYYFTPDVSLVDGIGEHVRLVAPKRSVLDQHDTPPDQRRIRPHATIAYHLFPSTMLFMEKAHASVLQFRPVDTARCELRLLHLTRRDVPATAANWDENIALFREALDEDVTVLEASEHGLGADTGVPDHVVFGRNEPGLQLFRRHLAAALAEPPPKKEP